MSESFDYIIVGAGSAGCVLANKLSGILSNSVLLIESGATDNHWLLKMPRGIAKIIGPGSPHSWYYEATPGGNRSAELWQKGKTLGGSSSINGSVYVRGHPMDYDRWEQLGCPGWGWKNIEPIFVAMEDHEFGAGDGVARGVGGPLKVTVHPEGDALCERLLKAAAQAGVPRVKDNNNAPDGGMGYQPRTIWHGRRQSASTAFLDPVKDRKNLHIKTNTNVVRVVFSNRRAVGVEIEDQSGRRVVTAEREVILAAGALQSPELLQISGVGPADLLHRLGIEVVHDSPNVGKNLREHLVLSVRYQVTQGGLNAEFSGLKLYTNFLKYLLLGTGPLTHAAAEMSAYIKTRPELDRPDVQIGVGLYSLEFGSKGLTTNARPGITFAAYFMHPQSQGEIRIQSTDGKTPLLINANYLTAEEDRAAAVAAIRAVRRIVSQPAIQPYIVAEIAPGPLADTDEDLLQYAYDYGTTGFHVSGTCRMGSDEAAVVDPELRVRGVSGLRVVDTSIFPELVSGNTNGPAMAIAWRASQFILETKKN